MLLYVHRTHEAYTLIDIYIYMYICMCACVRACVREYVGACVLARARVCVCVCVHSSMNKPHGFCGRKATLNK